MVAVTITLAAVTAAFVMDIGSDRQFQAGGVSLEIVYGDPKAPNPDDPYIKIQAVSTGGAERLWVQGNSTDKWLIQDNDCDYETHPGDYILFPVPEKEGFTVYAEKPNGNLQVIQTDSVVAPNGETSSGSYLSGCGYGDDGRGTMYSEFMSHDSP